MLFRDYKNEKREIVSIQAFQQKKQIWKKRKIKTRKEAGENAHRIKGKVDGSILGLLGESYC